MQYMDVRLIPKTESLKDTVARVLPYWSDVIFPEIKVHLKLVNVCCLIFGISFAFKTM